MSSNTFFVITGGPGSGKTTLLNELAGRGFKCIPEVAREIIKEQVASKGDALPWKNTSRYTTPSGNKPGKKQSGPSG